MCTLIRLLLRAKSDLGPYCLCPDQITPKGAVWVHFVSTLIRLLLGEQSDLGLYCLYPDQITLERQYGLGPYCLYTDQNALKGAVWSGSILFLP